MLWEKNDHFEPETNFVAWALTIARYEVLSFHRRSGRDRLQFGDALIETLADDAQNCREQLSGTGAALDHCLNLLKPRDRRLLADRYQSSASVQGIAQQFYMQGSRYADDYYEAKERLAQDPKNADKSPGWLDTTARVIAAKKWAGDLLIEWKTRTPIEASAD